MAGTNRDGSSQLVAKQGVEWLGQLARDRVLIVNQQAPEERQIELPPQRTGSLPVGRLAVPDPRQGTLEVALGLLEVTFDLSQAPLGAVYLPRQAFLEVVPFAVEVCGGGGV